MAHVSPGHCIENLHQLHTLPRECVGKPVIGNVTSIAQPTRRNVQRGWIGDVENIATGLAKTEMRQAAQCYLDWLSLGVGDMADEKEDPLLLLGVENFSHNLHRASGGRDELVAESEGRKGGRERTTTLGDSGREIE
eukprot:2172869-Rhodomonas_salina.1